MKIEFNKYHGAGNDFVIIDNRNEKLRLNPDEIAFICDRHFGIGADGLMLLQNHAELDFEMIYYNSDGRDSSMCGNGGRCIVSFAHSLGVLDKGETQFQAIDGLHRAKVLSKNQVSLQMGDVFEILNVDGGAMLLDTGSPHYIKIVEDLDNLDLIKLARDVRYSPRFESAGVNVNFVKIESDHIKIRTYERGVENETLACGTGVTAAAIALNSMGLVDKEVKVLSLGGELSVRFDKSPQGYKNIWKTGPTAFVFKGIIEI
jgi:diaminopimelate epimerase